MLLKFFVLICLISTITAGPRPKFRKFEDDNSWNPLQKQVLPKWKNNESSLPFRLPNNTVPLHYDIYLITDVHIPNFDFFGTVTIDIRIIEDTEIITLNYRQIQILTVDLFDSSNDLVQSNVDFKLLERQEFLVIDLKRPLRENSEYKVRISYRGILRTDEYGFYRASYVNEKGNVVWLATTQFQAIDARHAFPCYDEPQIRTTFDIRIRHHGSYHAVSNMPVESVKPAPIRGFLITSFKTTPSMQTYLVAFTVSDFIYVEDRSVVPPQRVYARAEPIYNDEASLAMEVSPKIMFTCEEYFGIKYSLPKMDQIAITDFDAGGMENWGLVSYREIFLLFDPLVRTTRNKEWIIVIIAHEFAHQWIGNMVSPEWWTYLWINEGFATLYEYLMPQIAYPQEKYIDLFLVDVQQRVFLIDADPNIRPMSYYIDDPEDIESLFDWISYSKAGSVLHTFMHGLGYDEFQKGVQNFILDRYDNFANPGHLHAALQSALNTNLLDVAKMMSTWEHQPGFPLLTVTRDADNNIRVHQERFFYDQRETSENIWAIPINFASASSPDFTRTKAKFWLMTKDIIFHTNDEEFWGINDWVIFNLQQNYYYRVNYDLNLWNLIIDQLNSEPKGYEIIHVRNRGQLIDDAFHLALSDRVRYNILFGLMEYLWQETDYVPWIATNRAQVYLNRWLSGSSIYPKYQEFMRHNTRKLFEKLGVKFRDNELILDRYSRSIAVSLACQAQSQDCLQKTNQELVEHLENNTRIAPEYLSMIYCQGIRTAHVLHFLLMKNLLFQSNDQSERNRIIDGLACTQNIDLLSNFLNLAVLPGVELSANEKMRILTSASSNGEDSLWVLMRFTREVYNSIRNIHQNALNNVLRNIAINVGSQEVQTEFIYLISIFAVNNVITPQEFLNHRQSAQENLRWQSQNLDDVIQFFDGWTARKN